MSKVHLSRISLVLFTIAVTIFFFNMGATSATAQGLLDAFSPIFSFPRLEGEARLRLIGTQLLSGKVVVPSQQLAWDLKSDFGLEPNELFLDSMVRVQLGRLSVRLCYEMRDYKGNTPLTTLPNLPFGEARFDYTGLRLGGDFDVVQWGRSRAGIDLDYDLFNPNFTANIYDANPGKQINGTAALTIGTHIVYNPTFTLYGVSGIAEARARWSVSGTELTDWEVSGGLKSPETVLGSVALEGGYRRTSIGFHDTEVFNNVPASTDFNADIGGWFGEIVYYY